MDKVSLTHSWQSKQVLGNVTLRSTKRQTELMGAGTECSITGKYKHSDLEASSHNVHEKELNVDPRVPG